MMQNKKKTRKRYASITEIFIKSVSSSSFHLRQLFDKIENNYIHIHTIVVIDDDRKLQN